MARETILWLRLIAAALFLALGAGTAFAERVALVIGNSAYEHTGQLNNPVNDATDIAAMLEQMEFEVDVALDVDGAEFANRLAAFTARAKGAEIALLYYSGHGLQFEGESYLMPVDATLANSFAVRRETIPINDILAQMQGAEVGLVFLDACRNNPLSETLARSLEPIGRAASVGRGLVMTNFNVSNMLIAYAAAPGDIALDGTGRNSPFTTAILEHLPTPGEHISVLLKRVRQSVAEETRRAQLPEFRDMMETEFFLVPPVVVASGSGNRIAIEGGGGDSGDGTPVAQSPIDNFGGERLAFEAAMRIDTVESWQGYLKRYPEGFFADLARAALNKLGGTEAKATDVFEELLADAGTDDQGTVPTELTPYDRAEGPARLGVSTKHNIPTVAALERETGADTEAELSRALSAKDAEIDAARGAGQDLLVAQLRFEYAEIGHKLGRIASTTSLGIYYAMGTGVARDAVKAAEYFERAIELGSSEASFHYGTAIDQGFIEPYDATRAASLVLDAFAMADADVLEDLYGQYANMAQDYRNETRAAIQQLLADADVYDGKTDGNFTLATYRALQAFAKLGDQTE